MVRKIDKYYKASVNDTHVSDQPPAHLFLPACFCHYFPMCMRELC